MSKKKISLDLSPISEAVLKAAKKSKNFKNGYSAQSYVNLILEELGVTHVQMQNVPLEDIREMQETVNAEKAKASEERDKALLEKAKSIIDSH